MEGKECDHGRDECDRGGIECNDAVFNVIARKPTPEIVL